MAKYIVEVKDGETLYKAIIAPDGEPYITPAMGNVYTEPDTEAAYAHGYSNAEIKYRAEVKEAYQKGLSDTWEAARKIICEMDCEDRMKIFGGVNFDYIFALSPTTVIEKIRQYEQEHEEIQLWDEVINGRNIKGAVTAIEDDGTLTIFCQDGIWIKSHARYWKKTGRHFPEIAEVLKKMREE